MIHVTSTEELEVSEKSKIYKGKNEKEQEQKENLINWSPENSYNRHNCCTTTVNNKTKTNPVSKWTKNLNRHFSQEEKEVAKMYLKRHSTSLSSREMQIKNIYLVAIILQNVKHTVTTS